MSEQNVPDPAPADTAGDAAAAAGLHRGQALDGNAAIAQAAEQAKNTAAKNLPELGLGPLPVPDDTANLRFGPNLNDALLALLPLVGIWRGTGQANIDGEEFTFGQQLVFAHDGEDYLTYSSRIWRLDADGEPTGPLQRETGFWRISLSDEIEVTATVSTGVVEVMYGEPLSERSWQLQSASTIVTEQGPKNLGAGKRLYGLMPNNDLGWVDERVDADGQATPYMSAQLQRVAG